jgi:hypothetical protein
LKYLQKVVFVERAVTDFLFHAVIFLQLGGAGKLVFKDLGLRAGNMLFLDSLVEEMCF